MKLVSIKVEVPAAELPVSVDDFINHARINGITVDRQTDLLTRELIAATQRAERFLRRSIMTQTLKGLYYPGGPSNAVLAMPRGPVQSVVSVQDQSGADLAYVWDGGSFIVLETVPSSPVTAIWVSGYGDADDVPESVKEGILEYATQLYGDREGARVSKFLQTSGKGVPVGVRDLWRSEQIEISG